MTTNVLIVDDNDVIRNAIEEYLTLVGYDVDTANNAASAMELMASCDYDIIVTDLHMPDLGYDMESGFYLLKYAKQYLPKAEVIVMSGDASLETSLNAIKHGAYYFFSKPFSLATLKDKIDIIGKARFQNAPGSIHRHQATICNYKAHPSNCM